MVGAGDALELNVVMAGSSSVHDRLKALTQERDRLNGLIDQLAPEIGGSRIAEPGVETRQAKRVAVEGKATTCEHSCADHAALINPTLWSALPTDVLHLVFARLPMPDIVRLRCLSKQWNWNVTAKESEFRRTCASIKPSTRVFANLAAEFSTGTHFRLYDANSNKWHDMDRQAAFKSMIHGKPEFHSSDGGLVCCYLRSTYHRSSGKYPDLVMVGNILTMEWKRLPPIPCDFANLDRPRMVQIVMDRETKCYQVIVVGDSAASIGAVIYNSVTGTWSSANSLTCCFFGHQCQPSKYMIGWLGPCAFDCRQGKLLEYYDPSSPSLRLQPQKFALVRDRLFVFHEEGECEEFRIGGRRLQNQRYCISEYQGLVDLTGLHWVKVKVHSCGRDFEKPPRDSYDFRLHACEGFLLVLATNHEVGDYKQDLAWLYDMHVQDWRILTETSEAEYFEQGTMCELQWDAVP